MNFSKDTRIIDLTVGEFEELYKNVAIGEMKRLFTELGISQSDDSHKKRYVYGLIGIKQLFNCSDSTAKRLKNGKIKDAVSQYGRKIVVDVDKAMKLFNQ